MSSLAVNASNDGLASYDLNVDQLTSEAAPQIAALVALSDHAGHMTAAADSLGIPQSTMSRRIHGLEDRLGVPLVVKDGRSLRLTTRAVQLADLSRAPLAAMTSALTQVAESGDPMSGTIRFGFPLTMGAGIIPDSLGAFARRYPRTRLHLVQAHGQSLMDDLRRGALDLAVTIPAPDDLPHTVIARQRIYAAVSDRHPLAGAETIQLEQLRGEPFIANPQTYHLRRMTEAWAQSAGFKIDVTVEVTEFSTAREFVRRDLGVALLPRAPQAIEHFVELPLVGERYSREVAIASAAGSLTPVARLFRNYLVDRIQVTEYRP